MNNFRWYWSSLPQYPCLQPSYSLIAFSAVKFLSFIEESSAFQKLQIEMSSPRNKQQQEQQHGSHGKRIDSGRQREQQQESDNCFNSLSDAEEHFEFSPDIADDTADPHVAEESGLNDSKLSSDSFRSTSSASSLSNCNNNGSSGGNPFPRNAHLRQSFSSRNTSWSPRSNFNRRSLTSYNNSNNNQFKCISANGHARQTFNSNATSPSSRRSSLSDEVISSNDPASLEDDVLDLTQKVRRRSLLHHCYLFFVFIPNHSAAAFLAMLITSY